MVYFDIIPSGSKTRLGGIHGWSQRRVEIAGEGDEGEGIAVCRRLWPAARGKDVADSGVFGTRFHI